MRGLKAMRNDLDFLEKVWERQWTPPPRLSVVEWAEKNLYLPPSSTPLPGPFSTEKTPYTREILNAYDDPTVSHISLCFGAQCAKTMTMLVMLAFAADVNPANAIWMMPSTDMAKSHSRTRWMPIVDATPCLKRQKPTDANKFQILEQHFTDFTLNLIGGNSATQLASRSAGRLFLDEIDKLPRNLKKEANPCALLEERAKWFHDKKIVRSSTVTDEEGNIWQYYIDGTQEKYFIECPGCGNHFCPQFTRNVKWDAASEDMNTYQRSRTAYIRCDNDKCTHKMNDAQKKRALFKGTWVAQNPDADGRHRSFHFSEILSPLTPIADLVLKWLNAVEASKAGNTGEVQNFINSSLAEPWVDDFNSYKITESQISQMRDNRKDKEVPFDIIALSAGIDTQDDGFYYTVRAWDSDMTSWLVDYGFVTELTHLEKMFWEDGYTNARNVKHFVNFALIDAGGHRTDHVYDWCRRQCQQTVMPLFGRTERQAPVTLSYIEKSQGRQFGGFKRAIIDTKYFKDTISTKMKVEFGNPGAYYFHRGISDNYVKQFTAEYKDSRGKWLCPNGRPNHLFDCEVYCYAAAWMMKLWEHAPKNNNSNVSDKNNNQDYIEKKEGMW